MSQKTSNKISVYLEVGKRRTFAAALDWPGWCRVGRDETTALQALFDYGPRYARVLRTARLGFQVPAATSSFVIVERLKGTATTDFGAPDQPPSGDARPLDDIELRRLQSILKACWKAFDAVAAQAEGKPLRTGPRGGGRALDEIVEHVVGAKRSYLSALGGKAPSAESSEPSADLIHQTILKTLQASARGEIAAYGPRGGKRWSPRYFIRRDAWHVLDHLWEVEDRVTEPAD